MRWVQDVAMAHLTCVKSTSTARGLLGIEPNSHEEDFMLAGLVGLVIGAVIGAGFAGELGAAIVGVVGLSVGVTVHGLTWLRAHVGDAPVVERHMVMCTPLGHAARTEFVGDLRQRRWHDVRSCSLLAVSTQVDCDKGCVRLMNLSGVRPGAGDCARCAADRDAA